MTKNIHDLLYIDFGTNFFLSTSSELLLFSNSPNKLQIFTLELCNGSNSIEDIYNILVKQKGKFSKTKLQTFFKQLKEKGIVSIINNSPVLNFKWPELKEREDIDNLYILHELSYKCNLSCEYCDRFFENKLDFNLFPPDLLVMLIKSMIDVFKVKRVILEFAGGEPFFDINWKRAKIIINSLQAYKEVVYVFSTNGTLITKSKAKFLQDIPCILKVSIDGPSEMHNVYRIYPNGKGSYKKVFSGIKNLLQYNIPFIAFPVVTNISYQSILKIVSHFAKIGIKYYSITPVTSEGKATINKNILIENPNFNIQNIKQQYNYFSDLGVIDFDMLISLYPINSPCRCSGDNLQINIYPNGDVYFCCPFIEMHFPKEFLFIDTIHNIPLIIKKIKNHSFSKGLLQTSKRISTKCRSCNIKSICSGLCIFKYPSCKELVDELQQLREYSSKIDLDPAILKFI